MKRISLPLLFCFSAVLVLSANANAGIVLVYDSNHLAAGGSTNALDVISAHTDSAFVSMHDASTSLGADSTFSSIHAANTHTVIYGNGRDMQFQFGLGASDQLNGNLFNAANFNGHWLGFNYTAAQGQIIDQFQYDFFNNFQNGTAYAARDAALFLRIGNTGTFQRFGAAHNSTGNGNKGTKTLSDTFTVLSGQEVQFRLAFTDRQGTTAGIAQRATRIGSLVLSASAIPEPSSFAMFSILGFLGFRRRR